MQGKIIKFKLVFMELVKQFDAIISDTRGEFTFDVDGHKITATFTENRNDDLLPRLKEILIGNPVIRENSAENRNKKPPKKRDRDAR